MQPSIDETEQGENSGWICREGLAQKYCFSNKDLQQRRVMSLFPRGLKCFHQVLFSLSQDFISGKKVHIVEQTRKIWFAL